MAQSVVSRISAATLSTRVLGFWFRDWQVGSAPNIVCQKLWFQSNNQSINLPLKRAINAEFRPDLVAYLTERNEGVNGPYTALETHSPEALLALTILTQHIAPFIDQLSNQSLSQSSNLSVSLSMLAISNEFDRLVDPVERCFFYTPALLSEDPDLTNIVHQKSQELLHSIEQATNQSNNQARPYLKFIRQFHALTSNHFEAIQQYGRLPHLNTAKQRTSTAFEINSNQSVKQTSKQATSQQTKPSAKQPSKPAKFEWPE